MQRSVTFSQDVCFLASSAVRQYENMRNARTGASREENWLHERQHMNKVWGSRGIFPSYGCVYLVPSAWAKEDTVLGVVLL